MVDVLILEDNSRHRRRIESDIPTGIDYLFVRNGSEFEEFLASGKQARLYFLDDEVPDAEGAIDFHFIKHSLRLREARSDARVFYIGSIPNPAEQRHCEEYGMKIIDRSDIGRIISQELTED